MTKKIYSIFMVVALFAACVATTGCKKDEPQQRNEAKTYHFSINAFKGADNGSKANGPRRVISNPGDGTLNATWGENDLVSVYLYQASTYSRIGELRPTSSGSSETTLVGDL